MSVLHIVHGDAAGGTGLEAGLDNVAARLDNLVVGRCEADAAKHRAYRVAQWKLSESDARRGLIGLQDLAERVGKHDGTIVVWTTPTWSDRCFTWELLHQLAALEVDRSRMRIAELTSPRGRFPMGAFSASQFRESSPRSLPLEETYIRDARALWSRFVDPSPLAFDEMRRAGVRSFPDLAECSASHATWFPWRSEGRLSLSDGDQLLLDCLDGEWPSEEGWTSVLRSRRGAEIASWLFSVFGDHGTMTRFEGWCANGAVERRENTERPWLYSLRLTPLGLQLRDEGVDRIDQLPPIFVGGCLVNDPAMPWVRERDGEGWRLVSAGV